MRSDTRAAEEVEQLGADLILIKPIVWKEIPYRASNAIRERYAQPGDLVFVLSMLTHSFYTSDEAIVVYFIWQAGYLRVVSTFI